MNRKQVINGLIMGMPQLAKSLLTSLFQREEFPAFPKRDEGRFPDQCQFNFSSRLSSEKGMTLVLTLMILVLITAMVVEFSYGVYTTTSALHNWQESQKLSFVSKSGIALAIKTIQVDIPSNELYRFPGKMDIPVEKILSDFTGTLVVSVEDENAKFNLNSIVSLNGQKNAYDSFVRLLDNLGLDKSIADRIADWIDQDHDPRLRDSEEGAKNGYLDSVDELLLIKGIDRVTYERLLPYVTVYSYDANNQGSPLVNINTASITVIMSLANISKESAETLVNQRKIKPFNGLGEASNVGVSLSATLFTTSAPVNFHITSVAEENKIKRVIETVVTASGFNPTVKFWREM